MVGTDYHKLGETLRNRTNDVLQRRIKDTLNKTAKDFLSEFEAVLREQIFNKAIEDFYNDYDPEFYIRNDKGSGNSLYDILQTEQTEVDGEPALRFGFDPGQAPPFSSGYNGEFGVYDQSFRKGWHGGNAGGIVDDSLKKSWRVSRGGKVYNKRGKQVASIRPMWSPTRYAEVKTPSPFVEYKEMLKEYTNNEGPKRLNELFLKNW